MTFRGLTLETRQIRNCQGRVFDYYRYGSTGPWYRSLVSAQFAIQGSATK